MDAAESEKVYGPWAPRKPVDAARLFTGYPGSWWIVGGWALEAFTGRTRDHEDLDPVVLRGELPLLRRHLAGVLHIWAASSGTLKPLTPDDRPDAPADDVLLEGCGQVWTRQDAAHPWEYDILLSSGTSEEWIYTRDETIRMPIAKALWQKDRIHYLQPEISLLYKARNRRPKDDGDFVSTLPFLDEHRRGWLRGALERTLPGHDWISRL